MRLFKLFTGFFTLLLVAVTVSSCSKDDDDESNSSSDGSTSGWAQIASSKFSVKYGYYVDYGDGEIEITCSDTDLSDIFKGKSFKKTISMIDIFYELYNGNWELSIDGGYKVYIDTDNDYFVTKDNDAVCFYWEENYSRHNPSGSDFDYDKNGNTYSFTGSGLKADAYLLDEDDDETDLGLKDFSLSVKTSPKDISSYVADLESRGIEITVITDSQQKKLFRKYFGRK